MDDDDRFSRYQAIAAMFEAHSKPKPSPAALKVYGDALAGIGTEHFDAAMARAARELKWPARPAELRTFAFEAKSGATRLGGAQRYLCHFHGDGKDERGGVGRPGEPSHNPTMWWCDRCTHFAGLGLQQPAERTGSPGVREVVRNIADRQT